MAEIEPSNTPDASGQAGEYLPPNSALTEIAPGMLYDASRHVIRITAQQIVGATQENGTDLTIPTGEALVEVTVDRVQTALSSLGSIASKPEGIIDGTAGVAAPPNATA